MGKKIVFFDIDGTVWDWKQQVPDSCYEAIGRLRENGHLAFICSGRAYANLRADSLKKAGFDGVVAACGGYVEIDGKVIYNRILEQDVVKLSVETVNKYMLPVVLEGPEKHWISDWGFDKDVFVDRMYKTMGNRAVTMHGYTEDMYINKFSADVLRKTDYKMIKEILAPHYVFIEHGITPDFEYVEEDGDETVMGVIEAVPHGVTKATGVKLACESLGIDFEDTYAIGDSANDIDMFNGVRHSICMGNGADCAKAAAEFVTTDIYDNGIMNALEKYGLI